MSASYPSPDSWWQTLLATLPNNSGQHGLVSAASESLSIEKAESVYPLPHYGLIDISGPDASKFLQGQLTADVDALSTGNSTLAAHCDPKGRMHASFTLHCVAADHYLLHLPLLVVPTALAALNKYAVFSKVSLVDLSQDYAAFASSGLNDKQQLLLAKPNSFTLSANIYSETEISDTTASTSTNLNNTDLLNHLGLIHWIKRSDANALIEEINQAGNPPQWQSAAQWEYRLINAGVAYVQLQTIGEFIPQMLNYDYLNGISFTKGCYTGQEIIARLKYRGQVKRRCYAIEAENEATIMPGHELLDDKAKSVGNIASVVAGALSGATKSSNQPQQAATGQIAGLAVLKVASIGDDKPSNTQLSIKTENEALITVNVKALPYAINNSGAAI